MSREFIDNFPIYFVSFIVLGLIVCVVSFAVLNYTKKQDAAKELIIRKAKILEKLTQQGAIAWYIVEFDNGERAKLRTFKANNLLLSVGDVGTIKYRGITIEEFQR